MSKVYSFRLNDDNPREAQAREVIEAWVEEGYSLRHVIVEALLTFKDKDFRQSELDEVVEQLKELILTKDKQSFDHTSVAVQRFRTFRNGDFANRIDNTPAI